MPDTPFDKAQDRLRAATAVQTGCPAGLSRRTANPTHFLFIPLLLAAATAQGEALADPTRPPAELASPQTEAPVGNRVPALQSILSGPGRRTAILDGRVYREGETIGAYKLGKITPKEVRLNGPEGELTLRLPSPAGNLKKNNNRP